MNTIQILQPKHPLISACEEKPLNLEQVKETLLQNLRSIDISMALGALTNHHKSSDEHALEISELLLQKGATCDESCHLLHVLAQNNFINVLEAFFDKINLEQRYEGSTVALRLIAFAPDSDQKQKLLSRFLAQGLDPNQREALNKNTLLHWAAIHGDAETAKKLLAAGADINSQNYRDQTPAIALLACEDLVKRHSVMRLFLQHPEFNPNELDDQDNTVMHFAVRYKDETYITALLEARAAINPVNLANKTPFMLSNGDQNIKTLFSNFVLTIDPLEGLKMRAAVSRLYDETPAENKAWWNTYLQPLVIETLSIVQKKFIVDLLYFLAEFNDSVSLKHLAELGFNIHEVYEGKTAIFGAVEKNAGATVNWLIKHQANLQLTDKNGWTVLHIAMHRVHEEIIKCLLSHSIKSKVNINATTADEKKQTALHLAVKASHVEGIRQLITAGADANIADARGNTPLQLISANLILLSPWLVNASNEQTIDKTVYDAINRNGIEKLRAILTTLTTNVQKKRCAQTLLNTVNSVVPGPEKKNEMVRLAFEYQATLAKPKKIEPQRPQLTTQQRKALEDELLASEAQEKPSKKKLTPDDLMEKRRQAAEKRAEQAQKEADKLLKAEEARRLAEEAKKEQERIEREKSRKVAEARAAEALAVKKAQTERLENWYGFYKNVSTQNTSPKRVGFFTNNNESIEEKIKTIIHAAKYGQMSTIKAILGVKPGTTYGLRLIEQSIDYLNAKTNETDDTIQKNLRTLLNELNDDMSCCPQLN